MILPGATLAVIGGGRLGPPRYALSSRPLKPE
jgi:hypothetical protein